MGRSFTARLVIPLTLAAALVISVGLFIDYELSRRRILDDLAADARAATQAAVQRIQEMTAGVESSVRLLGDALHDRPDAARVDELLRGVIDSNRHIFGAALAFAPETLAPDAGRAPYRYRRGDDIIARDLGAGGSAYWREPWFSLARERGEPLWVEPYFDDLGGRVLMTTFSAPIHTGDGDARGRFLGVVTADVALSDLNSYLESLRIDRSGFGFLLTRAGQVIGAPRGDVQLDTAQDTLRVREPGFAWSEARDALARGESVSSVVDCPGAADGCRLRIAPVSGSDWSVGVVYAEEALLAPLRNYEARVFGIGLAMLLLMAVTVSLIARRLTRPLLGLAAASEAIARGDLDVELPPVTTNDEVGQLLRAFDGMRRDLGDYIARVESAAAARSRMDSELSAARQIQMAMLPQGGEAHQRSDRCELWARLRPAKAVGGDLYSFRQSATHLRFCVGDVSDKGVPAALFMARVISLIQQWEVQPDDVPPEAAMAQFNTALSRDNDACMFVTLLLGTLDLRSGELRFASGGHSAPLLLRDGRASALAQERGPALALQAGLDFPGNRVQLAADDRLLCYTDGFDEACSADEQFLGEAALTAIFEAGDALPVDAAGEALFAAVDRFSAGTTQFDDMSALLLEIPGRRRAPLQAHRVSLPIDAELPGAAAQWLRDQWQAQGLWETGLHDALLILEELTCNVRDHARTDPGDRLDLALERYAGHIEIECTDPGHGFNPLVDASRARLGASTLDADIGGLGVHLVTALSDAQFYRREKGRNILRLRIVEPADHAAAPEEDG
jgi:sigma-B regulation protein RsbU (phosphoserine phosphatase)